jgi:hypothetical protein
MLASAGAHKPPWPRREDRPIAREELLDRQADLVELPLVKVRMPPTCPNEVCQQGWPPPRALDQSFGDRAFRLKIARRQPCSPSLVPVRYDEP